MLIDSWWFLAALVDRGGCQVRGATGVVLRFNSFQQDIEWLGGGYLTSHADNALSCDIKF